MRTWFRSWLTARLKDREAAPHYNSISSSEKEMAKKEPMSLAMNTRVLFVCMGNICRSPMAEGVFRHLVRQAGLEDIVKVASAGTRAFHLGEVPDKRAQAAAAKRGFDVFEENVRYFPSLLPELTDTSASPEGHGSLA